VDQRERVIQRIQVETDSTRELAEGLYDDAGGNPSTAEGVLNQWIQSGKTGTFDWYIKAVPAFLDQDRRHPR
jgi:hypothetical protein